MIPSLNTILYGPPGTGKTYNTTDYAVAIIEGKSVEDIQKENHAEVHKRFLDYKEKGQIAFTTFHQSYGYEDFIEGIRPVLDDDNESVGYELHDGSFKEFCRGAELKSGNGFETAYAKLIQDLSEKDEPLSVKTLSGKTFKIAVNSRGNLSLFTGQNEKAQGVLTKEKLYRQYSGENAFVWWKSYYLGVERLLKESYGLIDPQLDNDLLEDETGTEAAAVTIIEGKVGGLPKKVTFHANRPFVYVISEKSSGIIFFIGQYMGDAKAATPNRIADLEVPSTKDVPLFNVNGQRMEKPVGKGLYIQQGKKYIIK